MCWGFCQRPLSEFFGVDRAGGYVSWDFDYERDDAALLQIVADEDGQ